MNKEKNIIKVYYSNPPNSLRNMFRYNNNIKKIDFSHFDTSKVRDMNNMLANCNELEYINMTGINTSSVTDMGGMFQSIPKLTSLDLSSFNTSSVLSMECMFCSCSNLVNLNISNFNTSLVKVMSHMFSSCVSLESLDLSSFSTNKELDMSKMLYYCIKLKSIQFPKKNKIFGLNMGYLFKECSSLTSLDLSSFDTSFTLYINGMFEKCLSLTSLDLSSFNTSNIIDMGNMFKQCRKLEFLDLSNFDTKLVINMEGMFSECDSLIYLNLKSFIIYNSTNINYIFSGNSLKICCQQEFEAFIKNKYSYINNCSDICFSDTKKIVSKLKKCIKDCNTDDNEYKYEYNNKCFQKCPEDTFSSPNNQFLCLKTDCVYYNIEKTECFEYFPEGYYIYDSETKIIDKCHENCKTCNKKGDENNNNCITCKNGYFFEDGNCVKTEEISVQITQNKASEVPGPSQINISTVSETQVIAEELTHGITQNIDIETKEATQTQIKIPTIPYTQKLTEKLTHKTIPDTESQTSKTNQHNIPTQNVKTNWDSVNFFFGLIDKKEINISKDDIINNIKEDIIKHKVDNLLSNVTEGKEDIYIKNEDVLYQITTTDNQKNNIYNNISSIKLGECENILKGIYGIDTNLTLIILKIDYYLEGLLIPIIGYEVYHPENKSKLNLSYCNETLISYNIPVTIDENNLFKYDQNSEYYNDECSIYTTEDGTDILINDRKEEFIQNNMSLCENICTYTGYDQNTKKALCECGIKYQEFILSEIEKQTDLLSNNLTTDDSSNSNLGTMKCYQTLFSKDGLLTNIGNYILLFIIIVHMISIVLFYKCGYYILENKIKGIISNIKKNQKLFNSSKSKKNGIYRSNSTKIKIKKKKTNKKSKFKKSNPSKKIKKSNKNRAVTQEKTDKSNSKLSKIKYKNK